MGQKILEGIDSIRTLVDGKKYLLVKDEAYEFLDIKNVINQFDFVEFSEFTSNPLYEQVCEGIRVFNDTNCEMIVAVGGGSAIDVAKCIKLFCKMDAGINYLEQEQKDTGIPLLAIPTTAGTGSESTKHAVIYYNGIKQSISHDSIIPNYAVLDASVLKSLSIYQKKCTMLDALCQAIESWWSVNSTEESISYSKCAIQGIKNNWEEYLNENTEESSKEILKAANFAGRAINLTATTAAHAMSYKLTSLYKLPHGHAVAICMQEVWKYMNTHLEDCIDSRGVEYFSCIMKEIEQFINLEYFNDMVINMDMKSPVTSNKAEDLIILTESVNPGRLKNNPVKLTENVLNDMYGRIVKE